MYLEVCVVVLNALMLNVSYVEHHIIIDMLGAAMLVSIMLSVVAPIS